MELRTVLPGPAHMQRGRAETDPGLTHQELRRAQHVQGQRLYPRIVYPQLPVDARTFYTSENAQVHGQPGGIWCTETREG